MCSGPNKRVDYRAGDDDNDNAADDDDDEIIQHLVGVIFLVQKVAEFFGLLRRALL